MTKVTVKLPDGSELLIDEQTTVEEIAYEIGPGLGDACLAGRIEGELLPKEYPIRSDCSLAVVTPDSDDYKRVLRWTGTDVLANAVLQVHPEADLVTSGIDIPSFFIDIDGIAKDAVDMQAVSDRFSAIVEAGLKFTVRSASRSEAVGELSKETIRQEVVQQEFEDEETVFLTEHGDFVDIDRHPVLPSTASLDVHRIETKSTLRIGGDKSDEIYHIVSQDGEPTVRDSNREWRREQSSEFTRIEGVAFQTEQELADYEELQRERRNRSHRNLAKNLNLVEYGDHSPGNAHLKPDGVKVMNELKDFFREIDSDHGFQPVETPDLNKTDLWEISGHYDFFIDHGDGFAWVEDDEEYGLKPVNCPHHMFLYSQDHYSYADLPVRFSEMSTVFRNRQSGELSGLQRSQQMTQLDGHAFVRWEDIDGEFANFVEAVNRISETFGFDHVFKIHTRRANSLGPDDVWERTTGRLREALEANVQDYDVVEGGSPFYAPKVNATFIDSVGQHRKGAAFQLDAVLPDRFGLSYVTEDNEQETPVVIHRAMMLSLENVTATLLEHFDGKLPPWLVPEQVRILPVSGNYLDYAQIVKRRLDAHRVSVDASDRTLGKRIREAHEKEIPYILIVGDDEEGSGTVSVRDRKKREDKEVDLNAFAEALEDEIDDRVLEPRFLGD